MTVTEIINIQEQHQIGIIHLTGGFYKAFGKAAAIIAQVTGYQLCTVKNKRMQTVTAGFPASVIGKVTTKLQEAGISIHRYNNDSDKTLCFDMTATPEPTKEIPEETKGKRMNGSTLAGLYAEVMAFNVADATPMEAMNFISTIQRRYHGTV